MDGRVKAVLDDLHILYELIEIDPAFSDTRRKLTDRRESLQRMGAEQMADEQGFMQLSVIKSVRRHYLAFRVVESSHYAASRQT